MNDYARLFLAGALLCGCSPSPSLESIQQGVGADMGFRRRGRGDMGFDFDMGFRGRPDLGGGHDPDGGLAPCPPTPPGTLSFCYYIGGADSENLATALTLTAGGASCDLTDGVFSVNATATTCTAEFAPTIPTSWGFSSAKPIHLVFSYGIHATVDSVALSATNPAGSMNEIFKVGAVYGSQNQVSVLSSAGAAFTPGFHLLLGGTAKKAGVTLAWISVWQ